MPEMSGRQVLSKRDGAAADWDADSAQLGINLARAVLLQSSGTRP
jgi:hypothetical protein